MGALRRSDKAHIATVCTKTVYNYIDMKLFVGISNEHLPVKREKIRSDTAISALWH